MKYKKIMFQVPFKIKLAITDSQKEGYFSISLQYLTHFLFYFFYTEHVPYFLIYFLMSNNW